MDETHQSNRYIIAYLYETLLLLNKEGSEFKYTIPYYDIYSTSWIFDI